jgi:CRP/FNR family transcriptional regulator, dissimilatory nitrate respiration regulator
MQQAAAIREVNGNGASRDPRLLEGVLSNVSLFRGMAQRQLSEMAARSKVLHFRRGTTICAQGQCCQGVYALAYGQVKLAFRGQDGDERVLRVVGSGDTFGLAVAILGRPMPFEVAALDDSMVVTVPAPVVLAAVENDPRVMRAVINALAERTLTLMGEVESGSMRRGVQRLASYLDALAVPNSRDGTCLVRLPTTKTVVASRLGVKKETLSRMLRDLAKKGLIAVEQREIAILDRLGLAAIAREAA